MVTARETGIQERILAEVLGEISATPTLCPSFLGGARMKPRKISLKEALP